MVCKLLDDAGRQTVLDNLNAAQTTAKYFSIKVLPTFDLDDRLGEAYLALCECVDAKQYDPTRGANFKTYINNKVRYGILNKYKKQFPIKHENYQKVPIEITTLDIATDDYENLADTIVDASLNGYDIDLIIDVKIALGRLPPVQRKVVLMRFMQDFTGEAIRERLGLSVRSGVNASIRIALTKLRRYFDDVT